MADWTTLVRDLVGTTGLQGRIANDARNTMFAQQQAQQGIDLNALQLQGAQREAQQQLEYDAAVQEYSRRPTAEGLLALAARFPKQAQALKQAWEIKDNAQRTSDLSVLGRAHAALRNNRPDLAIKTLTARRDAEKARGMDTSALDQQIEALASGDMNARRAVEGGLLAEISAGSDPAKFGATYENVGGEVQNGFTLSPGSRRFDNQGNQIAFAPFAPRPVTVGEGETVVEYQPGGGDQGSGAAGGDIVSRMLPITLQSESGNRDYAANGQPLTSSAGAVGRMQVMPGTNLDPGFGVRPAQDSSMEERARVGRDYLSAMVQRYGNPAQAWAAYNAGPGRVDKAIQEGGRDWLSRLPQETQAYVRKNVAQLGGNGAGASEASPRLIATGAPKSKPTRMSPQEVAAEGLNPDKVYYRGTDGIPKEVGGQDSKDSKLTEIESKATGYLAQAIAATNALNTVRGYNPSEVALYLNDLSNKNPVKRNLSQIDRRVLNAQLAFADSILRLETGAAIQPFEIARKAQVLFPMPGDGPEVQADKRRQREAAIASLRAAAGRGSRTVKAAIPAGTVSVRSIQEAQKLAPGTIYLAPDGKLRRR